jgi:MIP family channel proteins
MNSPVQRYGAEALGTFVLVAIGPGAAMVAANTHAFGHAGVALAFGLAVMIAVASLGPVSGAHINPSVTLALWSARRFPGRHVVPYMMAQCAGGIGAAFVLHWVLGPSASADATVPTVSLSRAFVIEAGYSGLLAFVIARVIDPVRPIGVFAAPLIGATVLMGALVTGPLTGGSFNPARSVGPAIASGVWTAHWLYWLAPTLGMMLGIRLYGWTSVKGAPPMKTPQP